MNFRHVAVLFAELLSVALASAASTPAFTVKVLSAQTRTVEARVPVPRNCDMQNYDAYCRGAVGNYVEHTLVLQEPGGGQVKVACLAYEEHDAECTGLALDRTFQAKTVKQGIEIRYLDPGGKPRKELYQVVNVQPSRRHRKRKDKTIP